MANNQSEISDTMRGLSQDEAENIRRNDNCMNVVHPPINCPAWACVVLPCINKIPSMKQFLQMTPLDAEVLRDSEWICYDPSSLVRGDVIRLAPRDIVPADCIILEVYGEEIVVDVSGVTGEPKPRIGTKKGGGDSIHVYYGSRVLQGSALAKVLQIGENTLLARMMKENRWPPSRKIESNVSDGQYNTIGNEDDNAETV
mmetsp:Transcript_21038/g.32091  ORF Transcript_21038/g.32091 Transcript_21038/m.32091 type:complete len:200 (+) Transcript_21038:108-707(+)